MGFITDSMVNQLGQIGKPKTTTSTSTSTATSNEPLNIGNMALMALMLMEEYAKKTPNAALASAAPVTTLANTPVPQSNISNPANLMAQAQGNTTNMDPMQLMALIQKMFGGGGGANGIRTIG